MATPGRMLRALLRGRLGVDVASALDLVGGVLKYLSLAFVVPAGIALAYGEAFWPFLAAGALSAGSGWALDRATGSKKGELVRPREGFLVV
ncbi:MAG: TrkH family potassium uptake protein, partial [Thermoleophilia bacterium]|nr:TrkH family potassium uptake protein [Thermoleophilia bacterium]